MMWYEHLLGIFGGVLVWADGLGIACGSRLYGVKYDLPVGGDSKGASEMWKNIIAGVSLLGAAVFCFAACWANYEEHKERKRTKVKGLIDKE